MPKPEEMPAWAWWFCERVSPLVWHVRTVGMDGFRYTKVLDTLSVIVTGEVHRERRWLHVSLARPSRLPSWADVKEVKAAFIGDDLQAIQVLPKASEYVNRHPYCLHLWHCLDGDGLPDFTYGTGML